MSQTKQRITPQALQRIFAGRLVRFTYNGKVWSVGVCKSFSSPASMVNFVDVHFANGLAHRFAPKVLIETTVAAQYDGGTLELVLTDERKQELTNIVAVLRQGLAENRGNETDWNEFMCDALERMHKLTTDIFGR